MAESDVPGLSELIVSLAIFLYKAEQKCHVGLMNESIDHTL